MTTDTSELGLEALIVRDMTGEGAGWVAGNPVDYERSYCVDLAKLRAWLGGLRGWCHRSRRRHAGCPERLEANRDSARKHGDKEHGWRGPLNSRKAAPVKTGTVARRGARVHRPAGGRRHEGCTVDLRSNDFILRQRNRRAGCARCLWPGRGRRGPIPDR